MSDEEKSNLNETTTRLYKFISDRLCYSTPPIVMFITGLMKWYFDSYNCAFGAFNKAKRVYPELMKYEGVSKHALDFLISLDEEYREEDLSIKDMAVLYYNDRDVRITKRDE